ncbi:hypothetical protein TRVA0_031S01046 [Trichomonascus vanleenenianus]|uniref:uncharacterized protein n=1 Tax=Trichomonascus vanleenenianus TaxID=2268995 RepID=UPI003ECADAEB
METVGTPPDELNDSQVIGTIIKPRGSNLFEFLIPTSHWGKVIKKFDLEKETGKSDEDRTILISMPPKFRNTVFVKRGGYVLVELYEPSELEGEGKVKADICNIVTDKKDWQRYPYWPTEYKKSEVIDLGLDDESEEEEYDYGI